MSKSTYLFIFIALIYVGYKVIISTNGANAGELAPDFTSKLIDESKFSLTDLRGNYVLLDFWGSWCGPCRNENPRLVALYDQFKNQNFKNAKGFEVVTVALEKNDRTWRSAATKDGFSWNYQIVEQVRYVALSPIARKYGVSELPSKFLISPDGELLGKTSLQEVEELLSSKLK